jgi:hypothetical protein
MQSIDESFQALTSSEMRVERIEILWPVSEPRAIPTVKELFHGEGRPNSP